MSEGRKYIKSKSLGYLSGSIHGQMRKTLERQLTEAGLPLKIELFPVINRLFEEDSVSQQTIADWFNFDRHRISRMLDELEQAGFIERKDDPNSRRSNLVCLTPYTLAHKEVIHNAILASIDIAFQGFSADEVAKIIEMLEKIHKNLK
jgi:DNA-binding MarR family transcriptional regulator